MADKVRPLTADEWAEWIEEWRRQGSPTLKAGRKILPFELLAKDRARARARARLLHKKAALEKLQAEISEINEEIA